MSHLSVKLKSDQQFHEVAVWHEPLTDWLFDTKCGMLKQQGSVCCVTYYLDEEYPDVKYCMACEET